MKIKNTLLKIKLLLNKYRKYDFTGECSRYPGLNMPLMKVLEREICKRELIAINKNRKICYLGNVLHNGKYWFHIRLKDAAEKAEGGQLGLS